MICINPEPPECTILHQINLSRALKQDRTLFVRNQNTKQEIGICMMAFTQDAKDSLDHILDERLNYKQRMALQFGEEEHQDLSRPLRFLMSAMELAERTWLYEKFKFDGEEIKIVILVGLKQCNPLLAKIQKWHLATKPRK